MRDEIEDALTVISTAIDWENYTPADDEDRPWTVAEVLYSRIEWVEQNIEDSEMRDTLSMVKRVIEAVGKVYKV